MNCRFFLCLCFYSCCCLICQPNSAYACHVTDVCATKQTNGSYTATFTYTGGGTENFGPSNCIFTGTTLPADANSSLATKRKAACDKGQGQTFPSGTGKFSIAIPTNQTITWQMPNGTKVSASKTTKSCPCPGASVKDACGICGGDNSSCMDCARVPNGTKTTDQCGVCLTPSDPTRNKSCLDCKGVINGTTKVDACGICGGDSSTCKDCAGKVNGTSVVDLCGVCGGQNNTCLDCLGTPNGNASIDACGICGGANACNDCAGVPFGGSKVDGCGVCGGNGSTCRECEKKDISGLHIPLDVSAHSQRRAVNSISAAVLRVAKGNTSLKKKIHLLLAEADTLYHANWALSWSTPNVVLSCNSEEGCVVVDVQSTKIKYLANSVRMRDIGNQVAKALKRVRKNKLTAKDKKMIVAVTTAFNNAQKFGSQIPDQTLVCAMP